jgi:hypothetical protein
MPVPPVHHDKAAVPLRRHGDFVTRRFVQIGDERLGRIMGGIAPRRVVQLPQILEAG